MGELYERPHILDLGNITVTLFSVMYTTTTVRVRARSYRSQSKNADAHHVEVNIAFTIND